MVMRGERKEEFMANNYEKWTSQQKENWNVYNKNYAKSHFKSVNVKLRLVEDKDIIDFLAEQECTTSDYIRHLIREQMKKRG